MSKIKIWNYGDYKSDNYGSSRAVSIGSLELYFSYETVIAFKDGDEGIKVCKNVWSKTTGKHLNWLEPDKKKRLSKEQFNKELEECLRKYNLEVE